MERLRRALTVGLTDALKDERRFFRLLAIIAGAIAILKGLRLPYNWAATQAQIDYRYGFLRRGFLGEVCRQLHLPIWKYSVFTALSFALLAAFLFVLAWSVRRSGLNAAGLGAFSALLAGSFCISTLVNLVGFYDIVMAVLVLLTMLVRRPWLQLVAVAAAGVVGVLVHELYAVAFLPVSLMGAVCWASETRAWSRWLGVIAAAVVPWMIVMVIAQHPAMTLAQGEAMKAAVHARVDFVPYDEMLTVLTSTSRDNLTFMLHYMGAGSWWVEEGFGLLAFLPTACFFLAVAFRLASGRSRFVMVWMTVSVFAPLALNLIGFDRYRWLTMMTLNAFLVAIAVSFANRREQPETPEQDFSVGWRRAATLLLVVNLATDIGFFHGHAKGFPFRDYWSDYRDAQQSVFQPE